MFDRVAVFGERAAVWSAEASPRLPVTLVLPGRRPPEDLAAARLGMRVPRLEPVDDGARARLFDDSAGMAYAGAVLDLGCWRYRVEHTPPGPALAEALTGRPEGLAPGVGRADLLRDDETRWADAVLASMQARARLIGHLQAAQYADCADLSAHYPAAHEFLAAEIALALSCTERSAQSLLGTAETLRDRLPATLAALSDGRIDEERAFAVVAATTPCTREVAARVEASVLPGAATVTAGTVRRRAERAVIACDPAGAAQRHRARTRERHVSRWAEPDGMAGLKVYSTAEDIAAIHEALTVLAHESKTRGDDRDLGNRRVDALVQLCTAALQGGCSRPGTDPGAGTGAGTDTGAGARRARPLIRVTMPITALLGGDDPCELDGHGPITAAQARAIAADGVLRRLVCDPLSGTLLDYGLTRYEPPETLKDHVRVRDGTCVMPICGQPAQRCDIDHVIPARPDPTTGLPTLGATADRNLGAECRHHHLSKDGGGGFTLHRGDDGSYSWTTPLGRTYRREPTRLWHPPEDHHPPPVDDQPSPVDDQPSADAAEHPRVQPPVDPDPPPY